MHDPMTQAFEITMPFTGKKNSAGGFEKYPYTLARIWHVDPETDGSDDSCGWFIRSRHANQETLDAVRKAFKFEYEYLFGDDGSPKFSTHATTLCLFMRAGYQHFKNWKLVNRYIHDHLVDILYFAENPTDSLYSLINQKTRTAREDEEKWKELAVIIYAYILRDIRPWWQHPRWHVHHWKIQIPFIQQMKRFLFSRCAGCGKSFKFGESPTSTSWDSDGPKWFRSETNLYHSNCIPALKNINKEIVHVHNTEG